jgi:hypothetical protein
MLAYLRPYPSYIICDLLKASFFYVCLHSDLCLLFSGVDFNLDTIHLFQARSPAEVSNHYNLASNLCRCTLSHFFGVKLSRGGWSLNGMFYFFKSSRLLESEFLLIRSFSMELVIALKLTL